MEDYKDLADAGYYGRLDLPDHLTKRVVGIMDGKRIPCKDLAARVYRPMGVRDPKQAARLITNIRCGRSDRLMPSAFRKSMAEKGKTQLYKISVLLHALEVEITDPLVRRLSRNYHDFKYPPRYKNPA